MAVVAIIVEEILQFACWTADVNSGSFQCEGLNGYFTALRITDVQIYQGDSFLLDPQLIYPQLDQSPQNADPGLYPDNPETYATILIYPAKGFTFQGSGMAPMLLVRDVFTFNQSGNFPVTPAGSPTTFDYDFSSGDYVTVENMTTGSVTVIEAAMPSDLGV
jgi:hypothetical protein